MTEKGNGSVEIRNKVEKKYDDKEDNTIKEVASYKENSYSKVVFCFLIVILGFSIANTIISFNSYKKNKDEFMNKENVIEIKRFKDNILIVNDGNINEKISDHNFDENGNFKIERITSIQLKNEKDGEDSKVSYNLRYDILENNFEKNAIPKSNSDVKVKFYYSYDKKEWTSINNVISTTESTINPLMSKEYDISGIIDNLKVITNTSLEAKDGENNIIYWKSETIFHKEKNQAINNNFKANFKIQYVEN